MKTKFSNLLEYIYWWEFWNTRNTECYVIVYEVFFYKWTYELNDLKPLSNFFHVSDDNEMPKKGEPDFDLLYKVWSIINFLLETVEKYNRKNVNPSMNKLFRLNLEPLLDSTYLWSHINGVSKCGKDVGLLRFFMILAYI